MYMSINVSSLQLVNSEDNLYGSMSSSVGGTKN